MRILILAGLLAASSAIAQESPLKGPATQDPTENSTTPRTYSGCVTSTNGNLFLTTPSHSPYLLVSGRFQLKNYVGHEVRMVASNINPGDPSSDERARDAGDPPDAPRTLDVEDIENIADHCRTGR